MNFDDIKVASWYPGHMLKATNEIRDKLKLVDVIIELVDARAPFSTQNFHLGDVVQHKARLTIMAKSDLAAPEATKRWSMALREDDRRVLFTHMNDRNIAKRVRGQLKWVAEQGRRARGQTHDPSRRLRGMVIGLPNVGKSTLINRLAHGKKAQTGPRPGVTRHQQWIKVGDYELLDTPGVMVPRISDAQTGLRMGLVGALKDELVGAELLVEYLHWQFAQQGFTGHQEHYKFDSAPTDYHELLDMLGRKRGFLGKGGAVDQDRAIACLLQDFRAGRLGPMSLEEPK